MLIEKNKIKDIIIELLGTIIGSAIMAFGLASFLLPNQLSSGGFSGIATITYYLMKIPMGAMIFGLNLPLFLFAGYRIGKNFFIKSIIFIFIHIPCIYLDFGIYL